MPRNIEIMVLLILVIGVSCWTSYSDIRTGRIVLIKVEFSYLTVELLIPF